jgi:hypothetical protein
MEVAWEERAQGTIYKAANENLVIVWLTLTLGETAGETSGCGILLAIFYLQWHKVCARHCVFGGTNGGKKHGVAHTKGTRTIGLLCQLSGLNGDGTSIRK